MALAFTCPTASGQLSGTISPEARAEAALQALKKGGLVVRLQSNRKKIEALESALARRIPFDKDRARLEKRLSDTRAETLASNQVIAAAFKAYLTIAPVYFTYDYVLFSGEPPSLLMDASLAPLDTSPLVGDQWLALRFGALDVATTSGAEAMILQDAYLKDLAPPFPYGHKLTNFGFVLNKVLDPDKAFIRNMRRVVIKLDRRLERYEDK